MSSKSQFNPDLYDLRRYGLAPGERFVLQLKQGGVCAICGRPPRTVQLNVDHCHKCSRIDKRKSVRGLLCQACNRGIFRENPELLRRAADYFSAHKCTPKPLRRPRKPNPGKAVSLASKPARTALRGPQGSTDSRISRLTVESSAVRLRNNAER